MSENQIENRRPIIVIDGMNLFVRHFMANDAVTSVGEPCGGVVGFLKALNGLTTQFSPERILVVWEQGGPSPRRKKIHPDYKENRTKIKSDFKSINLPSGGAPLKQWIKEDKENKLKQIKTLVDCLKTLPVCQIYVAETECDDIIAYLIRNKLNSTNNLKIIVSSDRDFYQLLDEPNVKIYNPADKSFHEGPIVKVKLNKDEFVEIPARNYVLVRTLTGDDSDNIEGVPGMGFKTALKHFPMLCDPDTDQTIQGLLEAARTLATTKKKTSKAIESLLVCEQLVKRNWQLMFLGSSCLAANQISKIDYALENFQPHSNKLELIKILLRAGIVTNINFDQMFYDMHRNLVIK